MIKPVSSFSSYSVSHPQEAKNFYVDTLNLTLKSEKMGLQFALPGGGNLFMYHKPDHVPAGFTVLNFVVTDIDQVVAELTAAGVNFERYEGFNQDDMGIARGKAGGQGPDIAWFKDPAGNILSVIEDQDELK